MGAIFSVVNRLAHKLLSAIEALFYFTLLAVLSFNADMIHHFPTFNAFFIDVVGKVFSVNITVPVFMLTIRKQLQIFFSIISFVPVNVVNNLATFQDSSKFLSHYKAVLINISFRIRHWVAEHKNFSVPVSIGYNPARPAGVGGAFLASFYKLAEAVSFGNHSKYILSYIS